MQVEQADIAIERETYEASRQGLNELYLLAKQELVSSNSKITELERDVEIERRIKVGMGSMRRYFRPRRV